MTTEYINSKIELMAQHGLNQTCCAFIRLHFQSGARISDLLRIKRMDITSNNRVIIRQSKGSDTLIIQLSTDLEFWREYRQGLHVDINLFSRGYFYKLYKRYGLVIFTENGVNNSITHSARKQLAREVFDTTNNIEDSKSALGHKSSRSTEYYLTNDQRKSNYNGGILGKVTNKLYNFKFQQRKNGSIIYL